jgi:hypothetical protein
LAGQLLKEKHMKISLLRPLCKRLTAGFSLAEGLIGVAVMGTVFVSLYTGMASGFQAIRNSRENTRATQIILEKFETIRLYNWDQLVNTPGFIPSDFTARFFPNTTGTNVGSGITYTGRVEIRPVPFTDPYGADMRSVTITLNWTTDGVPHNRVFTSFVAKYGIQNYVY